MSKVYGGKILIFGDMHLSSVYTGMHKDYLYECYLNMDNVVAKVKEHRASAVVFLGDLIGVNERNIKDRQFLLRVMLFFKTLNELTGGNVYSVKGNHDKGDFSDFDLFIGFSLIKSVPYIDYYRSDSDDTLEVRYHLVNYGDERRDLDLVENASNVVLGHGEYIIDGVTSWYPSREAINLSRLTNFKGVDLVVSGHIHLPSPEILMTNIGDKDIGLFYTGAPARTTERIDDCWYVIFEYKDGSTDYSAEFFGLAPASEVFYPKVEDDEDDEDAEVKEKSESLTRIVKEIMEGRMTCGDLFEQINVVPGATDEVKKLACDYLRRAIDDSNR